MVRNIFHQCIILNYNYNPLLGVGAFASPFISTQFATMEKWSYFFFISLGLAVMNLICLTTTFGFERSEGKHPKSPYLSLYVLYGSNDWLCAVVLTKIGRPPQVEGTAAPSHDNHYRRILGLRVVHVLAFFILAYVGVEVTIGGWIVTFVIDKRGGGASAGYLSSGFFGGKKTVMIAHRIDFDCLQVWLLVESYSFGSRRRYGCICL